MLKNPAELKKIRQGRWWRSATFWQRCLKLWLRQSTAFCGDGVEEPRFVAAAGGRISVAAKRRISLGCGKRRISSGEVSFGRTRRVAAHGWWRGGW